MTDTQHRSGMISWLLDDLVSRVSHIRHAVVLSGDGLPLGASSEQTREDAERLAAIASGFHSLAKGAGGHFDAGSPAQTLVELERGFLFVIGAAEGSCLAAFSEADADVGLVAYEMARLVQRVGEHTQLPMRAPATAPAFVPTTE
ncbi:roadblock/LC7 domain-containing protein [Streptomyces sp. NPDC005728]|uniref:roadblock/LC7 domain-containing protein n=1 Tax=Streptomyces sp. NPDC005728 TaxID=3157054 RepID=UPI0033E93E9F